MDPSGGVNSTRVYDVIDLDFLEFGKLFVYDKERGKDKHIKWCTLFGLIILQDISQQTLTWHD